MEAALTALRNEKSMKDVEIDQVFADYGISLLVPGDSNQTGKRNFYFVMSDEQRYQGQSVFIPTTDTTSVVYHEDNGITFMLSTAVLHAIISRHRYGMARILDEIPDVGSRQVPTIDHTDPYVVLADAIPGDYITHPGLDDAEFYEVIRQT